MFERFYPDIYLKSIFDIPTEKFKAMGISALVFDIDNTLAPFDVAEPDSKTLEFLKYLSKEGFSLCLLSKNNKNRVYTFNEKIKAVPVFKAGKPGTKKLFEAMNYMKSQKNSTALIGDQVFTDMYCAHRAGILAVYTEPMCNRDQFITKIKRGAEKIVLNTYKKKGRKNGNIWYL